MWFETTLAGLFSDNGSASVDNRIAHPGRFLGLPGPGSVYFALDEFATADDIRATLLVCCMTCTTKLWLWFVPRPETFLENACLGHKSHEIITTIYAVWLNLPSDWQSFWCPRGSSSVCPRPFLSTVGESAVLSPTACRHRPAAHVPDEAHPISLRCPCCAEF